MQVLRVSKSLEQRAWNFRHPLRQLHSLPYDVYDKLEAKRASIDVRCMTVRSPEASIPTLVEPPLCVCVCVYVCMCVCVTRVIPDTS